MSLRRWSSWTPRSFPPCLCHGPQITKASESEVQFLGPKISEIRETPPTSEPSFHSHTDTTFLLQLRCQMKFDTCDSTVNPGCDLNRREMIVFSLPFPFSCFHLQPPSPNLAPSPFSGAGHRESLTSAFSSVLKIGFKYSAD